MYHNHLLKEDKKMNLVCREAMLDLIIEFYKNNESYENIDQEENKVESSNDINIEKLKKENKELLLRLVESKRTIYYLTSKETDRLNLWV